MYEYVYVVYAARSDVALGSDEQRPRPVPIVQQQ